MRALGPAIALSVLAHSGVLAALFLWPAASVDGPAPITIELIVQAPAERRAEAPAAAPNPEPATAQAASPTPPAAEIEPPPALPPVEAAEAEPLRPGRKPRVPTPPIQVIAPVTTAAENPTPAEAAAGQSAAPTQMAAVETGQAAAPVAAMHGARPEGDNPQPIYPPRARREGLEGRVILTVAVGPNGAATAVQVRETSGHAVLDRAALVAVEQWRFRPASQGGQAVSGSTEVTVRFVLTE